SCCFSVVPSPPRSLLFPYTTLFRSMSPLQFYLYAHGQTYMGRLFCKRNYRNGSCTNFGKGLQHRYSPSVFLSYMVTMQYSTPFLKSIYRREQLLRLYNQIRLLFQTVLTINKTYCSTFSTHYNRFSTCCLPFKLYSF